MYLSLLNISYKENMEITKLQSNKFKTNLCSVFLTLPLKKETVTKNALLTSVLRRGTKNLNTQEEISKKLEEMYGAGFNCGVDKIGNYHVLKFYLETLDNKYVLNNENNLQDGINLLLEIIFNPLVENEAFKKEYVEQEKENLTKMLLSRKDNKASYAIERLIEEMFDSEPYSLYKYGSVEDLQNIEEKSLYKYYKKIIKECKIDLFILGENIENINIPNIESNPVGQIDIKHYKTAKTKIIKENLDVTQGKLIIGLNTPDTNKMAVSLFNTVLGGGANSKLFQNVRERESLAYSASSSYIRRQNTILIKTGIEIANYEKTLNIIKEQLEEMKKGNITNQEFNAAKELIISSINLIPESAEDMIAYYFDQALFDENLTVQDYMNGLKNITKEQVVEIAKQITIDTIYFLKREE